MTDFIWFDNDNLEYGGIGVVEYGNEVTKIVMQRSHTRTCVGVPKNDNPATMRAGTAPTRRLGVMDRTVTLECEH